MATVDIHFLAAFMASATLCELAEVLPETDLIEDLRVIVNSQYEVLNHMMEGKHYGTDRLNELILHSEEIQREIHRLRECI